MIWGWQIIKSTMSDFTTFTLVPYVGKLGKVRGQLATLSLSLSLSQDSKVSKLSTIMLGEGGLKCLVVVKFSWSASNVPKMLVAPPWTCKIFWPPPPFVRLCNWLIDWHFYFSSVTHLVQLLFSAAEPYTHHSCIIHTYRVVVYVNVKPGVQNILF